MKILEYKDLDISNARRQYQKLRAFLEKDDFASAEVKKLSEHGLYRAKLDDSNRLIFKIVSYNGNQYGLILEVIHNHAYDRSKFLRGARINETKMPVFEQSALQKEPPPSLVYINPSNPLFCILDKIISFDPEQEGIYHLAPPLIIIGPAGSGKTALTLQKMRQYNGRILYTTLSPYLVDNSRNIYYAYNYENDEQEMDFLSFRELLETMRAPEGREISYKVFAQWLDRFPQQQRFFNAHGLYEEFRGVITGSAVNKPFLSLEDYMNLGVRQSIFLENERELAYGLFQKYIGFIKQNGYYDPNMLSHEYLKYAQTTYDFIVVDEVQDMTNIQLKLILKMLKKPDNFIFTGDSNQIVHPNFFSWSSLKSMLYNFDSLDSQRTIQILRSNFRNSIGVTKTSNRLLMIKQKRFGSIDRESSYLMNSLSDKKGDVFCLKDLDNIKIELNKKMRRSTKFAIIVMRQEDKEDARRFFETPLIFSVQEAKGLEYENVILVNFISNERKIFGEIINGIKPSDLEGEMKYMRSPDKTDKSIEVYKFYINSLYVAVTRAVKSIYLIEKDIEHPLIKLLGPGEAHDAAALEYEQSTIQEWQSEARKLELQGRQDQADEIRREILKIQPVPWDVCTPDKVVAYLDRACDKNDVSQKPKKILYEYSLFYDEPILIESLGRNGSDRAQHMCLKNSKGVFIDRILYQKMRENIVAKHLQSYSGKFYKDILRQCEIYGVNHRNVFNKTPLMLAAMAGNTALVLDLIKMGADSELLDNYGLTAWQCALQKVIQDDKFPPVVFSQLHELLAPQSLSLKVEGRLIKIDGKQGEFMLFHLFFSLFRSRIDYVEYELVPLSANFLAQIIARLLADVISYNRKKRTYISALLSKNEVDSSNPYNKKLFKRKKTGYYMLNSGLEVRQKDEWIDIYKLSNIELMLKAASRSGQSLPADVDSFILGKYPKKTGIPAFDAMKGKPKKMLLPF